MKVGYRKRLEDAAEEDDDAVMMMLGDKYSTLLLHFLLLHYELVECKPDRKQNCYSNEKANLL